MSERKPNCEWVLEHVEAFVDGELGAGERAAVTAHCATCAECMREMDLAIRVRRELRALPSFKAPAHVVNAPSANRSRPRTTWSRSPRAAAPGPWCALPPLWPPPRWS